MLRRFIIFAPHHHFSFLIQAKLSHVIKGAARPTGLTLKFESRDEWLGIRDWGLGVTCDWDSLASSSRAQPRDLYCTARIIVYAPRENDVLVLPHIR